MVNGPSVDGAAPLPRPFENVIAAADAVPGAAAATTTKSPMANRSATREKPTTMHRSILARATRSAQQASASTTTVTTLDDPQD